eukprot:1158460-Pelagomonas_calceolata.AAC.3
MTRQQTGPWSLPGSKSAKEQDEWSDQDFMSSPRIAPDPGIYFLYFLCAALWHSKAAEGGCYGNVIFHPRMCCQPMRALDLKCISTL